MIGMPSHWTKSEKLGEPNASFTSDWKYIWVGIVLGVGFCAIDLSFPVTYVNGDGETIQWPADVERPQRSPSHAAG